VEAVDFCDGRDLWAQAYLEVAHLSDLRCHMHAGRGAHDAEAENQGAGEDLHSFSALWVVASPEDDPFPYRFRLRGYIDMQDLARMARVVDEQVQPHVGLLPSALLGRIRGRIHMMV